MIAVDTSSMIDWLRGVPSPQSSLIDKAIDDEALVLPPPVETELLSYPSSQPRLEWVLTRLPRMELAEGVWTRAGLARRHIKGLGRRANLADSLIAQICIDSDTVLIATDTDFRHFADHCGLKLAL